MKKRVCLVLALLMLLCGCTPMSRVSFSVESNGNLKSKSGVEYARVAYVGQLTYLGELEFVGRVRGERRFSARSLFTVHRTGMYALLGSANDNVLIRKEPKNEWYSIYRKASLPAFDGSVDRCIRLEFVRTGIGNPETDAIHISCQGGVTDRAEIAAFLQDVRSQQTAREAGLYEMVKKPDGMLENCYTYGIVYGFFEEEPNLAVEMRITSFNDLAYSINVGQYEYVLPQTRLEALLDVMCER